MGRVRRNLACAITRFALCSFAAGDGSFEFETKEEAYQRFVQIFKDQPELVQNVSPEALPASFRIHLVVPSAFEELEQAMSGLPGIDKVSRGGMDTSEKALPATTTYRKLCPNQVGDTPTPSG